jgi:hypothetical protein
MPPCAVELGSRFRDQVRILPGDSRREIEGALRRLSEIFGKPHLHSGLGIRKLRDSYFECRVGRDTRMVFKLERSTLVMTRIGNHEDIRNFLIGR